MDINLTNPVTTAKIGEVVNGASAATPNDTDLLPVIESSVTKKLTLTNLKAFLKTYFDTLYSNLGYTAENVANKSSSYTLSSTTTYANTKALVDGLATKEPLKGSDDNYVTDAQLVVIGNTSGTNTGDETAARIGTINHGTSSKTTLVDADEITGQDSANSFSLIRVTCLNVYNYLKSKFDSVYTTTSAVNTQITAALAGYSRPTARWYSDGAPSNPADSSTQYFGILNAGVLATADVYRMTCTKTNAIYKISWTDFVATALASAEGCTIKINNITQATSEILTTSHLLTKRVSSSHLTSTLAFTAGDLFNIERVHPAYVTNPTVVTPNIIVDEY